MGTKRTSGYLSCPEPRAGAGGHMGPARPYQSQRPAPVFQKHGHLVRNEHLTGNEKDHNGAGKALVVGRKSFCSSWAAGNDHKTPLSQIHILSWGGLGRAFRVSPVPGFMCCLFL